MEHKQKMLRILLDGREGDRVRFDLPMEILEQMLDMGMELPKIQGTGLMKDLDLEELVRRIRQGAEGKLMDVRSDDGDRVQVKVVEK